ncbi:MAG: hypothetical protein M0P57_07900 [Syntrophales bacterium]|jgi:alpha/beta superfamily hydrolase|nr:hypothetical protein [Syntrophales bacterium]MDY0045281.1 hypothetical protein [Syntrophales bacterium]
MEEERVWFTSGSLRLEGLHGKGKGAGGVIITHPHSQMGGSMDNNVVGTMVSAFLNCGYATLRFNFRSVGMSEGSFDNGLGEQEDVKAARTFLLEQKVNDPILAGYSFGAWVNSKVLAGGEIFQDFIMISPPIDLLDLDLAALEGKCGLVICGSRDQFCPIEKLRQESARIGCRLSVVKDADHFYFGYEKEIRSHLEEYLSAGGSGNGSI